MRLLKDYLLLCWFVNNPLDLQPSRSFLWKCIAFYLASGCIVEGLISDPADGSLEVAMRTVVAFSSVATIVFVMKKFSLFYQLLTAIFMCENFIMTLGIFTEILDTLLHKTPYAHLPLYLGGLLVIWYLAIVAYIFRQMFEWKMSVSLLGALSYFVLTYGLPMLAMDI